MPEWITGTDPWPTWPIQICWPIWPMSYWPIVGGVYAYTWVIAVPVEFDMVAQ